MSDKFPDLPTEDDLTGEDEEQLEHRFSRRVAIAIVLATFAAACTAYLQSSAGNVQGDAASRATALSASAASSLSFAEQVTQMLFARYETQQDQLIQAATSEQEAIFGPGADRAGSEAERSRWLSLSADTGRETAAFAASYGMPAITANSPLGPRYDPHFPFGYLAASRRSTYLLTALRDASNELSDQAGSQESRYSISLTAFAVAVFLFGFSLTRYARGRRRLFAAPGVMIGLAATTWAVAVAGENPALPPQAAARAFANARVAYESGQYKLAVRDVTLSLAAWPEYVQARDLRAEAEFDAGSPQHSGAPSLASAGVLAAAADDEQHAIALGDRDSELLLNTGFYLFELGLERDDRSTLQRGLVYSRQAMQARPSDPLPAYNVAVTLLALGRVSEARAVYQRAVTRTVYVDPSDHAYRAAGDEEADLAGALTDLASVAAQRGTALRRAIDQIKLQIVTPITRASYGEQPQTGTLPRGADARASGMNLDVTPATTTFTILGPAHPDPYAQQLSLAAQWYLQAPGERGWAAIPNVSGASALEIAGATLVDTSSFLRDRQSYLVLTGDCLSPGTYRLELYDDGRLLRSAQQRFTFPQLVGASFPALGLVFCRPSQWQPITNSVPGLIDGYTSPHHRTGLIVISIDKRFVHAARPSPVLNESLFSTILSHFAKLLGGHLNAGHDSTPQLVARTLELDREYHYPGGVAAARELSTSGQLLVAITFGPSSFMTRQGRAILASASMTS